MTRNGSMPDFMLLRLLDTQDHLGFLFFTFSVCSSGWKTRLIDTIFGIGTNGVSKTDSTPDSTKRLYTENL